MKNIFKSVSVIIIAVVVSIALNVTVKAANGPYYLYDQNVVYFSGVNQALYNWTGAGCYGSNNVSHCRYLFGNGQVSWYRWALAKNDVDSWWAYGPKIGDTAVLYRVTNDQGDNWTIKLNQKNSKNQGKFVYIGASDFLPNTHAKIRMSNKCVPGFYCNGLSILYWDDIRYTTLP